MPKYTDSNGNVVSEEQVAQDMAIVEFTDLQTYLEFAGLKPVKENGVAETDASATPENNQASNGGLDLENGSSVSAPTIDQYLVSVDDLRMSEEAAKVALNKKLSRIGIQAEESLIGDALTFSNETERQEEFSSVNPVMDYLENSIGDLFRAVRIGKDKSDEELQAAANTINDYIKEKGDINFVNKAKERNKKTYEEDYIPYITPKELNDESITSQITNEKLEKFERIQRGERKNIYKRTADGPQVSGIEETPATVEDFNNEKEFLEYEQWKDGNPLNKITPEEKIFWDTERKNKYIKNRSSEWANDSDDETRLDMQALAQYDAEQIANWSESNKIYTEAQKDFELALDDYEQNPSIETYDIAFNASNDLIFETERLQDIQNKIVKEDIAERANYVPIAIADFNKNYSRLEQLSTAFKSTGATVTYGLATLAQMANNPVYFALPSSVNAAMLNEATGLVDLSRELDLESASFQDNIEVDKIRSLSDAGRWVAGSSMQMIPSLAMATTGPAALPLFFLSGYGGSTSDMAKRQSVAAERLVKNKKFLEDNANLDPLELAMIEGEMDKDAKLLNISNWRVQSTAALHGIAEVAFEKVGTIAILKSLKKGIQGMPPMSIKEGFKFAGNQLKKGILVEGSSEFGTSLVQNFGDIYILGEDKNFFEGGLEAFAGGSLMGGSMKSINAYKGVKAGIISELQTKEERKQMVAIVEKLRELTGVNELQNIGDLKNLNIKLPKEIQDQVDKLEAEGFDIQDQIIQGAANNLDADSLLEVGEINRKMRSLNKQLILAVQNPNIKPAQLKAYEAQLRSEFDKLENEKQEILTNESAIADNQKKINVNKISFDSTSGYQMYNQVMLNESIAEIQSNYQNQDAAAKQNGFDNARKKLEEEGIKDPTNEQIKNRSQEDYIDNSFKERIEKGETNAKKFAEDFGLNVNFKSFDGPNKNKQILEAYKTAGATTAEMKEMRKALKNNQFEGVFLNGTIIIDKAQSIKNRRIGVFAHEVLHAYAEKNFGDKNSTEAGKSLLDYLEKNDADMFAKVQYRLDQSYKEGDTKDANYYLEALNAVSDVIADGQKLKPNTINQMRLFYNKLVAPLGSSFQLKESDGAYAARFVENFNKSAHLGKESIIEGDRFKTEIEEPGVAKKSKSKAQLEKTKTKFEELESNFQSGTAQNAIASELFNMVDTQIGNRFNLRPQVKQDLRDDVIERIYKAQETTKWDGRGSLYGFINGRIAKRILDALRGDQSYLENIDNNQFEQLEKAAAVVVEDKPVTQKAKPQYKNLLKSNVLSSEAIANINSKVLTIVRTLKSKLNEKISNNRTVTPLIAEIKKEMGKQADIDLKKAMGGIKDNAIQKFLTKNKKAILENMTTTWLMGAIPSAVQKQVDGKFISNWKGQKIDRETVGTDNAGRTSGAEITRRKPNVASMPDAEFLSYFIADNKLIRGRKESLAKAMAEEISLEIFNTELQNENSEISKAFEQNQTLKGVELLDNYIVEVAKQTERGNAKFSKSLSANEANIVRSKANQLKNKLIKADVKLTAKRLLPFLIDTYPEIDEKRLKSFATEAIQSIQRYIKKIEITDKVDFGNFIFEGMSLKESNSNLLKFFGFLKNDVESLGALFNNPDLIAEQRGLELSYNTNLILKEGADGLIKILRWGRGHNVTSGKIGGGRNQIYAGNPDYLDNNLNNIPDVEVVYKKGKSTSIKAVFYKGIEVENWKERIQSPAQKPAGGIEGFRKDSQIREDAAREAWTYLTDYLQHIKDNGSKINWVMTMMSLKSNMSSVLKAAAPVKYYFSGNYKGPLRYEHMIPTEYMVLKLTDYYYNGKSFDLNTLRDKYNVAIIPVIMDNNFNVLTQSQMNSSFDPMIDSEVDRYFNENTYGYPNMFPIESLTGETKGNIEGETWVKFNNVLKPQAAKMSKSMRIADKAMNAARMPDYGVNPKGISVYDFDDTLAFSKSKIIVTMPDGKVTKITPAEFAAKDEILSEQGASFDFSEFNKVVQGTKGPLAARLEKAIKKFGNKNIYVLTARPQASAPAIYEFLKGIGLEIPLENITGLQDGRPSAKADWMIEKFSEGYNDFYFVDDAYKNVKAVQDVLSVLDVKSKVQQARAKFSRSLSSEFNKMIERNKGVTAEAQFSNAVAKRRGANIGKYKWFIPSSADDFRGLTQYTFAGKGKQGEADQAFFEKALMDPYFAGISAIESSRQMMKNAYANLLKQMKPVRKKLNKLIPDTSYTYDQAIRVYLWNKAGYDIPGLSKRDLKKLLSIINNDSDLSAFADGALLSSKQDQWSEPSEHWQAGTILKDLNELTEKVNRKEYLGEFIANSEILFSPENMNKIEALYGSRHREALEDALYRMRNGTNRPSGGNRLTNAWNNWVNNSVGTIMFFNRRSALLQLLSTVNFINWSDNNPLKASIAFANQPQYWKDWVRIFNSDKLKQRRGGLKSDIQEQEIASQAKNSKDKSSAIIAYLLKIGFTPTQIADSMAIATGGATFYRNRINTYLKQDMSKEEAEAKAWADFSKISDEAQQSGDPALVSQQQASVLGRLVLAFQNTPMQYTRLMKKAGLDIINRRGDFKTNFSKIIYYGAVQNFIFSALQNALFAMIPGFDDEEETEEDKKKKENQKTGRIIHSMVDTILRGSGLAGAVATTAKNTIRKFLEQEEKGFTADHTYTIIEAANISPPIGSKLRKLYGAIQTWKFDKDVVKERGFDVTLNGKLNISPTYNIIGNLSSALVNLPLDRALMEVEGIVEALDERNTLYQRIALALGWRTWGVGAKNEEEDLIKDAAKAKRKEEGKLKAKETRRVNKDALYKLELEIDGDNFIEYYEWKKGKSIKDKIEWLKSKK
jgi:hypothetical protein